MHIEKVTGRKSKALEDMINEPVIAQMKNGKVFGGNVDDYEKGVFSLYHCKLLDQTCHKWVSHGMIDSESIEDPMPDFLVNDVKRLFVVKSEFGNRIALDDALQFYIDPHHKPFLGTQCTKKAPEQAHSMECDAKLHDALVCIYTYGISDRPDDKTTEKMRDAFFYVRQRLLFYGSKIP
jgi:small nuclear ribonucleoprotein (snRNP)-like protein